MTPNIRLRCKTHVKNTCFTDENTPPPVCPLKHVPMCTFKTSTCVPAPRAHVSTRVRVVPAYTGRFERTHGGVFFFKKKNPHGFFQRFTPHHNTAHTTQTTHHTTTQDTTPHGDRQRQTETEKEDRDRGRRGDEREDARQEQREERRVKREKIHFQCGGAWPFFIGVVIFWLVPFAHET